MSKNAQKQKLKFDYIYRNDEIGKKKILNAIIGDD